MTRPAFQTSEQGACHCRRASGRTWLVAVWLATVILAGVARAGAPPERELPQPDDKPVLIQPTAIGDIEYRPGRGLEIGESGVTLGGFTTLSATRLEGDRGRLRLDSLDLFVFLDPTPYVHVFSDFAFENLVEVDHTGEDDESAARVNVERLYVDLDLNDRANFRLGKFFTPVGRWNQEPAEPLTWTTSRPIVTDGTFDEQQTGAEFYGSFFPPGALLTYTLYGQFLDPPTPDPEDPPVDHSAGARLELSTLGGWSLGGSYFSFSREKRWNHLGGFDGLWRSDRWEVSGEFLAGHGDPDGDRIVGLYLQGVARLLDGVHAVGRYEFFDPGSSTRPLNLYTVGFAWRPIPFLILKADYLFASRQSDFVEAGLQASVSLLF